MAKYYEAHEGVYQRLRREGHACWDKTAFDDFVLRPFLEEALARIAQPPGRAALDVGCGAGPATFLLAERGYRATGVDISATAIAMAEERAAGCAHPPAFVVGDALDLDGEHAYHLVVDSHWLHCIVFDDDRRRALAVLHRLLAPGGVLVVETMSRHAGVRFDDQFTFDEEGVLWRHFPEGDRGALRTIDGRPCLPQRRVLDAAALHAELVAAGFIVELERERPVDPPHEPGLYQAIARKRAGG